MERLIRFLCERVWDTEWSGVLFYTPSGNLEDGSLEIHCVDIFPMDIGNATYTEFTMSPDVISYMAENPELLDCKMGLVHSHNNMSTFFSGTDTATLREEGNERNHFVSLIVNNAGTYTAAITRKIKYHSVRDLSYEGFEGTVNIDGKEESEGEEIEYFPLEIVFEEEADNEIKCIADRLKQIKEKKSSLVKTTTNDTTSSATTYYNWPRWENPLPSTPPAHSYSNTVKEPTLFDDEPYWKWKPTSTAKDTSEELVTPEDVEKALCQLITGSVSVFKLEPDARKKVVSTIDQRFSNRFKGDTGFALFEYWATDFIDFLLWYSLGDRDVDECEAAGELAEKLVEALKKLPKSKYIDKYIELLITNANKL